MKTNKITKATFKSFIKNNKDKLMIKIESSFDGMTDCVEQINDNFHPISTTENNLDHTLGINGLWLVGQSRDYFSYFENQFYTGIEYYNSCGSGIIAISK